VRVLSGPEKDHRHTPVPAPSGAYEWWYFDALSDDGRYSIVAIFFLGSPMTPYYKAVVDGKRPDPMDWCGVFFTLHEKVGTRWKERAYSYNLYREGEFHADRPEVTVGGSRMTYDGVGTWTVSINERGLWGGSVKANLRFTKKGMPLVLSSPGKDENKSRHTWVCVAPSCRVVGSIGDTSFEADGYHDHNFGLLPFDEVETWYWVYAPLDCSDGKSRLCLLYYLPDTMVIGDGVLLLLDEEGNMLSRPDQARITPASSHRGRYGFDYCRDLEWKNENRDPDRQFSGTVSLETSKGTFAEGSFYVRLPVIVSAKELSQGETIWSGCGEGMGEVFRPSRLCGPIASRAMWSRIRRRKRP
jgi:hypothetical protein